jgi:cbb3-type cytochrome oxidase subunit 3
MKIFSDKLSTKEKVIIMIIGSLTAVFLGIFFYLWVWIGNLVPENRTSVIKAIIKLHITNNDIVQVKPYKQGNTPTAYIMREKKRGNVNYEPLMQLMEDDGWEYIDQFGSGFLFQKNGKEITVVSQMIREYALMER